MNSVLTCLKKTKTIFLNKKVLAAAILIGIILFSVYLRHHTFWLPHWKGDQNQYLALALKLEKVGFNHFNLRGVDSKMIRLGKSRSIKLGMVKLARDLDSKGTFLFVLDMLGVNYYDQAFYHKPPGFPFMLMLSHKLFADKNQPYVVLISDLKQLVRKIKPYVFFQAQFWAAVVPLFFSLGLVLLTFFLGKVLFSYRVGLYAAFLMAMNPISIMTSQYLLADDMMAFFTTAAVLTYVLGFKKTKNWLILLSGLFCGVGVLAKQTAGYFLIAVWIFSIFYYWHKIKNVKSLPKVIFNKHFILASIGVFLVSGFWFMKIYQVYGNPLWRPPHPDVGDVGWFKIVRNRPPGWILFSVGIPWLAPLFVFAYCSLRDFALSLINFFKRKSYDYKFIFPWTIIFVFGFMLRNSTEHRRMLPVYPLLAVFAGCYLSRLFFYLQRFKWAKNRAIRESIILALFLLSAIQSLPIAIDVTFGKMLVLEPF
jgi:4-amino-4-deoxy-L-arabinose transferase-like glycosyltransferase